MKNNPHYSPGRFLDAVCLVLGLKNDRQLAMRLAVNPGQICRIRKKYRPISPALLISIQEETDLSLAVLRGLMGDYRANTGPTASHPLCPPPQLVHALQDVVMQYAKSRVSHSTRAAIY